jgi:sulfane dehydrogenase subunit SoxC
MEWGNVAVPTVQYTHGMLSCSEFTGVPLRILLDLAGVDYKRARYVLAEGADGSSMTRTMPMELVESGEVLVAYGQNGEMLRPENGYPLRLVVPGVQGVSWVKYLRRIEVGDKPYGTKDETIHYVDLMPAGCTASTAARRSARAWSPRRPAARCCSTRASTTSRAWPGRAAARSEGRRVGRRRAQLAPARLEQPVMSKCLTRFNIDWVWDGKPAIVQSRATDDTGYVQPDYRQLRACAARARSITTTRSSPGWCRKAAR